jgi:hypothetical protein
LGVSAGADSEVSALSNAGAETGVEALSFGAAVRNTTSVAQHLPRRTRGARPADTGSATALSVLLARLPGPLTQVGSSLTDAE